MPIFEPMAAFEASGGELDWAVRQPGVLMVHWWQSLSPAGEMARAAFEAAALRNPGARFFLVNTSAEAAVARDYQVTSIPTLMVFRDGVLVFAAAGPFTDEQVEQLLVAVEALDMEEVRRGRNGHGQRAVFSTDWAESLRDPGAPSR